MPVSKTNISSRIANSKVSVCNNCGQFHGHTKQIMNHLRNTPFYKFKDLYKKQFENYKKQKSNSRSLNHTQQNISKEIGSSKTHNQKGYIKNKQQVRKIHSNNVDLTQNTVKKIQIKPHYIESMQMTKYRNKSSILHEQLNDYSGHSIKTQYIQPSELKYESPIQNQHYISPQQLNLKCRTANEYNQGQTRLINQINYFDYSSQQQLFTLRQKIKSQKQTKNNNNNGSYLPIQNLISQLKTIQSVQSFKIYEQFQNSVKKGQFLQLADWANQMKQIQHLQQKKFQIPYHQTIPKIQLPSVDTFRNCNNKQSQYFHIEINLDRWR